MLKVGIIGCGYWGSKHVRVFHQLPQAHLVMASDLNEQRREHVRNTYPGVEVTDDYRWVLDSDVDAVVIATPVHTHYQLAREALEAGKHVLVEKPLTANLNQARDLAELADARRRVLVVGHTFLYNPAVHALRGLVQSGELGEIFYVDSARLNLGLFQPDINVMWDLAPHDISILLYVLGTKPVSVSARGAAHVHEDRDDVAYLEMRFPGGVMAHVHVSWLDPCKVRRTTIVGSKKMAVYNDVLENEKVKIYDKSINVNYETDHFSDFHLSYHYGNTTILHIPSIEPLQIEAADFVASIEEGRPPRSDARVGLGVVEVLELAQRSLTNGGHREELDDQMIFFPWDKALTDVA